MQQHDGLKQDGTPDKRVNPEHGFGGDHERASELGKQGGKKSGTTGDDGALDENEDVVDDSGDYKPEGDNSSSGGNTSSGGDYKSVYPRSR